MVDQVATIKTTCIAFTYMSLEDKQEIKRAKLDPNVDNNSNSFCLLILMKTGCMLKWLACLISCTWLKYKIVLQEDKYKCFFIYIYISAFRMFDF